MIKDQRRAQQSLDKTASSLERLSPIAAAAKAALSGLAVMKVIEMADEWGQYASRIKMATKSTEEYTYVQERMLASANATFRSIQETRESFIQLSPVLREMGLSLGQSVDVIDSFSGLLVVNAASAEKAKGAQDALAKSLQKGSIDADAWMSIYSTVDSVVDLIAESSGKSAAEIRRLGAEGKLGIDVLVQALSDGSGKVAQQVKEMPTTVKDAIQSVTNALNEYVGRTNEASGITATISSVIQSLGANFNVLADTALVAVAAGLARYVGGMVAASIATAAKAAVAARATAAEVALAQAQVAQTAASLAQARAFQAAGITQAQVTAATLAHEAATKRLTAAQAAQAATSAAMGGALRGLIAFLTGPAGIAIAVGIAAASIFTFGAKASEAIPKVDELTASVEKLTAAQLANQRNKAGDAIGLLTTKARDANAAVKALERDQAALNKQFQEGRGGIDAKGLENVNRALVEARSNADGATKELQEMINADYKLAEAQKLRANTPATKAQVTRSDPEVQKRLAGMRDELELAKLSGAARARLQAIQKLGVNATAEERAEAEKLATTIYDLEQAQKKQGETARAAKFDSAGYLAKLAGEVASEREKIAIEEVSLIRENDKHLKDKEISVATHAEALTLIRQKAAKDRAAIDKREAADALMVVSAELAAQRQLQAEIDRQDADIAGLSMGERARQEMDQRLQIVQQFAQRAQQIEDQRRMALAQA
ncbi:tape measure protein, partial [Comamonas sp.]|uniref:tape measure protein n=1 Tax=Comamonas sp. TaxID=34028 RepID=UPI003A95CC12